MPRFALSGVPLSVYNRALDLYGQPREISVPDAARALGSAESRIDCEGPLAPFAQAVAEYMSLAGPWSEEDGEYAGENGYTLDGAV